MSRPRFFRMLPLILLLLPIAAVTPSVAQAGQGIVSFTPSDGGTVTTLTPSFSITTSGLDPTMTNDNPWVAVSPSFQVGYDGTLASLLSATGVLEPPQILWRVTKTGVVYFDRAEAAQAARDASST